MKNKWLFAAIGMCILTITACKKDSPLLTAKDWLAGTWKLNLQGIDKNANGVFDVTEENTVPDSLAVNLQLKVQGTGFRIGANNTYVDSLTWALLNNDQLLNLNINDSGIIQHLYYKFNYTSQTLTLLDSNGSGTAYFRYYKRQN
jgi:hypothetical protein